MKSLASIEKVCDLSGLQPAKTPENANLCGACQVGDEVSPKSKPGIVCHYTQKFVLIMCQTHCSYV